MRLRALAIQFPADSVVVERGKRLLQLRAIIVNNRTEASDVISGRQRYRFENPDSILRMRTRINLIQRLIINDFISIWLLPNRFCSTKSEVRFR